MRPLALRVLCSALLLLTVVPSVCSQSGIVPFFITPFSFSTLRTFLFYRDSCFCTSTKANQICHLLLQWHLFSSFSCKKISILKLKKKKEQECHLKILPRTTFVSLEKCLTIRVRWLNIYISKCCLLTSVLSHRLFSSRFM